MFLGRVTRIWSVASLREVLGCSICIISGIHYFCDKTELCARVKRLQEICVSTRRRRPRGQRAGAAREEEEKEGPFAPPTKTPSWIRTDGHDVTLKVMASMDGCDEEGHLYVTYPQSHGMARRGCRGKRLVTGAQWVGEGGRGAHADPLKHPDQDLTLACPPSKWCD